MSDDLKLYTVTVSYEYAVLADSEAEARSFAGEAARDCGDPARLASAHLSDGTLPGVWMPDDLVYGHHAEDVTLREAIDRYVPNARRMDLKLQMLLAEREGA